MMKMDSILFDLDGTLWNTVEEICDSWNSVVAKYPGIREKITTRELEGYMGLHLDEIAKKLFPKQSTSRQMQLIEECSKAELEYLEIHGGQLYSNLEATLKKLAANYKLCIVSNCQDGYIQCFFKAHGLSRYFTDFECSGVTGLSKGENIQLMMQRNHLKKSIFVGDTLGDAEAARFAGIPFVFARYGFGSAAAYDAVIDGFEELLTLELKNI